MSGLIRMGRRCTDPVIRATLTEEELAQKARDEADADARVARRERLTTVTLILAGYLQHTGSGTRGILSAEALAIEFADRLRNAHDDRFDSKSALDVEVAS